MIIPGPVADQPALHGLLVEIRDLGLPLVSVNRVEPGLESSPGSSFDKTNPLPV